MNHESSGDEYEHSVAELLRRARSKLDEEILATARRKWAQEQRAIDALPDTRPDLPTILSDEALALTRRMRLLARYPYLPPRLGGSALRMSKMDMHYPSVSYPQYYHATAMRGRFDALVTPLLCATEAQVSDEAISRDGYVFMNPPHPSFRGWLIVDHQITDGDGNVEHVDTYEVVSMARHSRGDLSWPHRFRGGVRPIDFDSYYSPVNPGAIPPWRSEGAGWDHSDESYELYERLAALVVGARAELGR